jgi:hypothetical protein
VSPPTTTPDRTLVPLVEVEQFYRDMLSALGEHAQRPRATAQGAAAVAKRVAREHGLEIAERLPLPRLTRAEQDEQGIGRSSFRSQP